MKLESWWGETKSECYWSWWFCLDIMGYFTGSHEYVGCPLCPLHGMCAHIMNGNGPLGFCWDDHWFGGCRSGCIKTLPDIDALALLLHFGPVEVSEPFLKAAPCRVHYYNQTWMWSDHESLWSDLAFWGTAIAGELSEANKRCCVSQRRPKSPTIGQDPVLPLRYEPASSWLCSLQATSSLTLVLAGLFFSLLAFLQPMTFSVGLPQTHLP